MQTKNDEIDRAAPISFSSATVRAIFDGKETRTRRLVRYRMDAIDNSVISRYGDVGNKLWVREPFYLTVKNPDAWLKDFSCIENASDLLEVSYLATDDILMTVIDGVFTSSHIEPKYMPRWASRLLLEITDIHVEKLHRISVDDVLREGYPIDHDPDYDPERVFSWYKDEWDFYHGNGSWESNPNVWVIEFKIVEGGKKWEEK